MGWNGPLVTLAHFRPGGQPVSAMFLHLWRREFRGAQRRLWRQPWVLPVGLVCVLIPLTGSPLVDPVTVDLPGRLAPVSFAWPDLLLGAWILWVVCAAIERDRRPEQLIPLMLTPFSRSEIAWAKTFAPTIISIVVIALLGLGPLVDADMDAFAHLGFDPRVFPVENRPTAMGAAAAVHMVLVPLFLATLASRMAVRFPRENWAFSVSLLIAIAVLVGTRLVHQMSPVLLPLCLAVILVYALALMDTRLPAVLLMLALWIAHMQLVTANIGEGERGPGWWSNYNLGGLRRLARPDGIREVIAYLSGPLAMAWIIFAGHDRLSSFLLCAVVGFVMSLELQWYLDPDGIWAPRAVLPLVILLCVIWLSRWRRWARRKFWDRLVRLAEQLGG